MGSTAHFAIPYPEPTAPVRDGSVNMKNLGDRVDAVLWAKGLGVATQSGSSVVVTNASGDANVPFPVAFTAAPTSVVAGPGDPSPLIAVLPYSGAFLAPSQFSVRVVYLISGAVVGGGGVRVNWIAQGAMAV